MCTDVWISGTDLRGGKQRWLGRKFWATAVRPRGNGFTFSSLPRRAVCACGLLALAPATWLCKHRVASHPRMCVDCHVLQTNWLSWRSCKPLLSGLCCSWESLGDGNGYQVIWFCPLMSICLFPSRPNLTAERDLPFLQKGFIASILHVFCDERASLISCSESGLWQLMGGLFPSSHFLQLPIPTITFFSFWSFIFISPLGWVSFLSVLFIPTAQIRLCVVATYVHAELSQHGRMPGARLHNQQITPSPRPATALLRLLSINLAMTSRLETSLAAGSSTPMHFLFPVKILFPASTQDRRPVIPTPTAHRHCIFRKIFSH